MTHHTGAHGMSDQAMQQCIQECLNCFAICSETSRHCLELGGAHVAPRHITALLDCAALCDASASFMLRHSELHPRVCGACAEACRACEASCRQIGDDDAMRRCADACARCADSCERMASAAAA